MNNSQILITIKYNTNNKFIKEDVDNFILKQNGVIKEVDDNYSVEDDVKAVLLSQKIYEKFGDDILIIKGYRYIDTLNLSKSNIL